AISFAIQGAGALIAVLTPVAKESDDVRRDTNFARECGVRIFPILADGDPANCIPIGLARLPFVDLRDSASYRTDLFDLGRQLKDHLSATFSSSQPVSS